MTGDNNLLEKFYLDGIPPAPHGLALGYLSTIIPVVSLGITILVAHSLCGMFVGMLGTLTMGLTIDAFGHISDDAGGIAEMSRLDEWVRERTDVLDAAENTTVAIGKGFEIGSVALVSLAQFGAFCVRVDMTGVDILRPWVFTGMMFGAVMPYAFHRQRQHVAFERATARSDTVNSACNGGLVVRHICSSDRTCRNSCGSSCGDRDAGGNRNVCCTSACG